jgi:hypothetical protein
MSYPILEKLPKKKVANNDKRLVVDGFPRSGNTFLADAIVVSQGQDFKFAHHSHLPENLLLGIELGIPSVVIFREPLQAIGSFMLYSEQNEVQATKRWIRFYQALEDSIDKLAVVSFEDIVKRPKATLSAISSAFDLDLNIPSDEAALIAKATDRIENRTARMQSSRRKDPVKTSCLPSLKRTERKSEHRQLLERHLASQHAIEQLKRAYQAAFLKV